MFLHADSEDSDQTGRMPRLICVFARRNGHFVGLVMRRLMYTLQLSRLASPSVECESDCGSRGCWFDSGPATYRSLKLIIRIFSLTQKGNCQMFDLLDG